jgi:hypothetical protein
MLVRAGRSEILVLSGIMVRNFSRQKGWPGARIRSAE